MSMVVGMLLHAALHEAGHTEYDKVRTVYDISMDEVEVCFISGTTKLVTFNIPAHLTDPVEFAKEKWPEWFVRRGPVQLDLFNQEQSI